jgi:alkylhydroperoxidase family enzyme
VLEYDGALASDARRAAFHGHELPEPMAAYAEKVRRHAYKVTDEDVDGLLSAGLSEDQVFELTVAVATGAGFERLDAGLRAIEG